jgi:hypothetical protein
MKYIVVTTHEVDVPEEGTDARLYVERDWHDDDPIVRSEKKPTNEELAELMMWRFTLGHYEDVVELKETQAYNLQDLAARVDEAMGRKAQNLSWEDPENGTDHSKGLSLKDVAAELEQKGFSNPFKEGLA